MLIYCFSLVSTFCQEEGRVTHFFYNKNWFYIIKLFLMNHKEKFSNNKLLFLNCFFYIFLYFFETYVDNLTKQ